MVNFFVESAGTTAVAARGWSQRSTPGAGGSGPKPVTAFQLLLAPFDAKRHGTCADGLLFLLLVASAGGLAPRRYGYTAADLVPAWLACFWHGPICLAGHFPGSKLLYYGPAHS